MRRVTSCYSTVAILALLLNAPPDSRAYEPLVTKGGLGTIMHPIQEPENVPPCDAKAEACKQHVHIFAINGLNPMCSGNFNGLCGYFKKQGYEHTYFGQLYTCQDFPARIKETRAADPEARIVLIGFSMGAYTVRSMANELAQDGTPIDLLVYMVGDHLTNKPESRPANVRRILNIRAQGLVLMGGDLFFNGADLDGARNVKIDVRHILVPSRKETLIAMNEELHELIAPSSNTVSAKQPIPEGKQTTTSNGKPTVVRPPVSSGLHID
jgi:Uncharacterized alpha/beta hydrolase domain (DUF2235)